MLSRTVVGITVITILSSAGLYSEGTWASPSYGEKVSLKAKKIKHHKKSSHRKLQRLRPRKPSAITAVARPNHPSTQSSAPLSAPTHTVSTTEKSKVTQPWSLSFYSAFEGSSLSHPGGSKKVDVATGADSDPVNLTFRLDLSYEVAKNQTIFIQPRTIVNFSDASKTEKAGLGFMDPRFGFKHSKPYKSNGFTVYSYDIKATVPLTEASKKAQQLTILGNDISFDYQFPKSKVFLGAEVYNRYRVYSVTKLKEKDFSTAWSPYLQYSISDRVNPYLYYDVMYYHLKKDGFFSMKRDPSAQFRAGVYWEFVKSYTLFPYATLSTENPSMKTSQWGIELGGTLYK